VSAGDGAALSWLHRHGNILSQVLEEDKINLSVRMSEVEWDRWHQRGR
jgi:GTP-binding protein HflX